MRVDRGLVAAAVGFLLVLGGCGRPGSPAAPGVAGVPQGRNVPRGRGGLGIGGLAPNKLPPQAARSIEEAERDRYWVTARERVDEQVTTLLAQHQSELDRGVRRAKLLRGDPNRKWIAITIDDGPHPKYTPKLLAILKQYQVPATFFVVGEMAEKYPNLVRAEVRAGHLVGNHTYHHVSLPLIPEEFVATEIQACGDVLRRITGETPHFFRPPGGQYNDMVAETAELLGYTMVLWTDDPGDYASPGDTVIERRTLESVSNGGIILLHDGIEQTVEVLPKILAYLQQRGYQFVRVDQMEVHPPAPLERRAEARWLLPSSGPVRLLRRAQPQGTVGS